MTNTKNKVEEPFVAYNPAPASLELLIQILGGVKTIGTKIKNILDFMAITNNGLPVAVLKKLQKRMQFTNRELGKSLDMSESTLQRRLKLNERLDKKESENTIQLASVWAKGLEVFEDEDDFRLWLHAKNIALGHNKPLDLLHSPIGREEIKNLLARIEWGIYS